MDDVRRFLKISQCRDLCAFLSWLSTAISKISDNMSLPEERSYEQKLQEFDSVPLFMRSLPDEGVDDTAITALQSLVHEGTPDGGWIESSTIILATLSFAEIAQNFKEQGNDYFKGKRYREALGFYSQGIDATPTDQTILDALLCNRAACNLELREYFI